MRPVRFLLALAVLAPAGSAPAEDPAQETRFEERVSVERVLVDARVIDGRGDPIRDLGPGDFRVTVGGQPVALESVQWVPGTGGPAAEESTTPAGLDGLAESPGRLVVLLFQKDAFVSSRIRGLMGIQREALGFLDALGDRDRVAVLVLDSHLRLCQDFTGDAEALRAIVGGVVRACGPARSGQDPVSLAARLDPDDARGASTPERALLAVARALQPLPGAKAVVLFGWGLGHWSPLTGSSPDVNYEPARRALDEARVSVFSLDVTQADAHSLAVGLGAVAADTGGFYATTFTFPGAAVGKVARALAGYYVLAFEKPALTPGSHALRIELVGRRGTVLAKRNYES